LQTGSICHSCTSGCSGAIVLSMGAAPGRVHGRGCRRTPVPPEPRRPVAPQRHLRVCLSALATNRVPSWRRGRRMCSGPSSRLYPFPLNGKRHAALSNRLEWCRAKLNLQRRSSQSNCTRQMRVNAPGYPPNPRTTVTEPTQLQFWSCSTPGC
jgi:hypothetical protein